MTDRITIRLGPLSQPLAEASHLSGRSLTEEIRIRLAESLGVDPPLMPQGFAAISKAEGDKLRRKAAKARRGGK